MILKRYRSFIILVTLVSLWCFFFAAFKFFFWSALALPYHPTLEHIASDLSLGSIFAYVIGGTVLEAFSKRMVVIVTTIATLVGVALTAIFGTMP